MLDTALQESRRAVAEHAWTRAAFWPSDDRRTVRSSIGTELASGSRVGARSAHDATIDDGHTITSRHVGGSHAFETSDEATALPA